MNRYSIIILILLSSCATVKTVSDYDPKVDFSTIETYSFYPDGLAKLHLNSLDKDRLTESITIVLDEKGFKKSPQPDILINIILIENKVSDLNGSLLAGGYVYDNSDSKFHWTNSLWSPYGNTNRGSIIAVDFIDPDSKKLIWHGQSTGFKVDDYKDRSEKIRGLIKRILDQYKPEKYTPDKLPLAIN